MSQHVFAWVAGFGWTLMPYAPFRFEQVPGDPHSVRVYHYGAAGVKEAVLTASPDGSGVDYEISPETAQLDEVVEVIQGAAYEHWTGGAAHPYWRIETSVLTIRWPEGFVLDSTEGTSPPVFDLVGLDDARVWIQGPLPPDRLPPLERMAGPGQTTVGITAGSGGRVVELAYEHKGAPWRMFHGVVDRYPGYACLVSAQTPARWRAQVLAAVEEVAASLTPCP